jgi:hypothetical protein
MDDEHTADHDDANKSQFPQDKIPFPSPANNDLARSDKAP